MYSEDTRFFEDRFVESVSSAKARAGRICAPEGMAIYDTVTGFMWGVARATFKCNALQVSKGIVFL